MQASIALQGDGSFEEVENYMDKIAEMQEEAGKRIEAKKEEMLDAINDVKTEMRVMQYSDDMG